MGEPLPGFDAPAVGFDTPYAMLEACHQRVQRMLELLGRLLEHVEQRGHDTLSRAAAADVLRYFDQAAPLHHQDEETHVFPLLRARGDARQQAAVAQLQDEHARMGALWARIRPTLQRWCEPDGTELVEAALRRDVADFGALYAGHIATEEGLVFPAAQQAMDAATQAAMGQEMQARRRG